ncbi:MAG: MBL fold metallo-hydrolase [Elusimicrobiota bacterium]
MIVWMGQSSFRLAGKIYTDPFNIKKDSIPAEIILISHHHFDHCSPDNIRKILSENTTILASRLAAKDLSMFKGRVEIMLPGEKRKLNDTEILAVPAYNTKPNLHPRGNDGLGFIISVNGQKIYHAGDTDLIPEMSNIKCDIALLPVSGTYVMTPEEAADAAAAIKPGLAIPMHYGSTVGTMEDAQKFCILCGKKGIQAKLLTPA